MKILFVAGDPKPERWTVPIKELLPEAEVYVWDPEGPAVGADYAIVWQPPEALFEREKHLKAVFNLGAGIDGLLKVANLPEALTVVRLEDAGMSVQMAEYVLHQLLEASRGWKPTGSSSAKASGRFIARSNAASGQWVSWGWAISASEWPARWPTWTIR